MPSASSAAMVAALIMPRSASTQGRPPPKRLRRRSTTGSSVVTSAVLPGQRKRWVDHSHQARCPTRPDAAVGGSPSSSPVGLAWRRASKGREVVSKRATDSVPNSPPSYRPCCPVSIAASWRSCAGAVSSALIWYSACCGARSVAATCCAAIWLIVATASMPSVRFTSPWCSAIYGYPAPIAMPTSQHNVPYTRTNALTLEKCRQRSIRGSDARRRRSLRRVGRRSRQRPAVRVP